MNIFFKSLFLFLLIFSCSKDTNVTAEPGSSVVPAAAATYCQHPDSTQSSCSINPGECVLKACKDPNFVEYIYAEEYQYYVDQYGGSVEHDPLLCKTSISYGESCAHPEASNYTTAGHQTRGACTFQACDNPNFKEYHKYNFYRYYVSQHGGEVISNPSLCLTKIGGCKLSSPYVSNFDAAACADNGSCIFTGCNKKEFSNYDENFDQFLADYLESLDGVAFTGSVNLTCSGVGGCTSPIANNKTDQGQCDSYGKCESVKENGTCKIECCGIPGHENYSKECADGAAAYQALLTSLGLTLKGVININHQCGGKLGCSIDKHNCSNGYSGAKENGSCNFRCCADKAASNYDASCDKDIQSYLELLASLKIPHTGVIDKKYGCNYVMKGCSFSSSYVSNYVPGVKEDGSCDIACCALSGYEGYSESCQATVDEYKGTLGSIAHTGAIKLDYNCKKKLGCNYNHFASNYDANSKENGSCNFTCCATEGYEKYDPSCKVKIDSYLAMLASMNIGFVGSIDNNHQCGKKLACNYNGPNSSYVKNYMPDSVEDGSCDIHCCADQSKPNYQPDCQSTINGYSPGVVKTGNINSSYNCGEVKKGCHFKNDYITNYMDDVSEDGSCDITCCNKPGYENYSSACDIAINAYNSVLLSLGLSSSGTIVTDACGKKKGCTVSYASNYDSEAELDDGSCIISCNQCPNDFNTDRNCLKAQQDYQTMLSSQSITLTGQIIITNNCPTDGCHFNHPQVMNYDANATEDGSCDIKCCSDDKFANYDSSCLTVIGAYQSLLSSLNLTSSGTLDSNYDCKGIKGCTNPKASNYNSSATVEDGSCSFECCSTQGSANYDPSCQSTIDSYLSSLGGATHTGQINNTHGCTPQTGCAYNHSYVDNFEQGVSEDGSCNIRCCSNEDYENYQSDCESAIEGYTHNPKTGVIDNEYNCGEKLGCSYKNASNYDGDVKEDGSCIIKCCSKKGHENFDQSCDEKISEYNKILAAAGVGISTGMTDNMYNCGPMLGCTDARPGSYVKNLLPKTNDLQKEDGSCIIHCCGKPGFQNYDPNCNSHISNYQIFIAQLGLSVSGSLRNDVNCGGVIGCMDPLAENYNPNATIDSKKECIFKACNIPGTENYAKDKPIRDAFNRYGNGTLRPSDCGDPILTCNNGFKPSGSKCICPYPKVIFNNQCINSCPAGSGMTIINTSTGRMCICAGGGSYNSGSNNCVFPTTTTTTRATTTTTRRPTGTTTGSFRRGGYRR